EKAANIRAASTSAFLQVAACEDNISKWKAEIREVEEKIAQEEERKKEFEEQAVEVPKADIDALAHKGLEHYSNGVYMSHKIDRLTEENTILDRKITYTREEYYKFKEANKAWAASSS
ncbi:hypothetical protein A2U01_0027702, partial [Trifolium medium]|nr:hypothetical protein [Trifolium medium]